MTSSATSTLLEQYRLFVSEIASKIPRFKPLNTFIQSKTQHSPNNVTQITAITFSQSNLPTKPLDIAESDLENELAKSSDHQLFVVENISPVVMALLGAYCDVDPQFFLDHIDASLVEVENSMSTSPPNGKDIEPTPWYRFKNIGEHLPLLRSVQSTIDHIHLRFIGSREYHREEADGPRIKLPDRIMQNPSRRNIERIAGGYNPVPRNNEHFDPVALTRHGASAWFAGQGKHGEWSKGIILLDPPFEELAKDYGLRQSSKYKSFVSRPLPPAVQVKDLESRETYRSSLIHCLKSNENIQVKSVPHPLVILQDLYRIIASEWIAINTYIERDLNTIAWQLETEKPLSLEKLENFLEGLFILRRRILRYQSLVDEQSEIYRNQMPQSWDCSNPNIRKVFTAIHDDLEQVQQSIMRNVNRISESGELITSFMSVRAAEMSLVQNETLRFLTIVATVVLPFNLVAAILAMQTEYGPGQSKFWIFWTTSIVALLCVWVVGFGLYKILRGSGRKAQSL